MQVLAVDKPEDTQPFWGYLKKILFAALEANSSLANLSHFY